MDKNKFYTKVLVAIPSLSRPEYITKKTMSWAKKIPFDLKIFVEPQEKFLYKQYNGNCIVSLPESRKGLMYSLNFIRNYALENGYEYVFQLDDDVDGFERIDSTDKVQNFIKTAEDCFEAMESYPKLGGIRFTQYRFWVYSKKEIHKWTHFNRPLQGIAFIRLESVPQINPEMREFTDTVTSLYIWRNGFFTLNYGLSGLSVVQNANKGGCQVYDRKEDALKTIQLLQKDFPQIIEKESKSWFGVDVDIDFYMKKYEYSPLNFDDQNLHNFLINSKFV